MGSTKKWRGSSKTFLKNFMIASIYQFQWLDAQMLLKPRRICPVITICLLCQQRIKKNAVSFKVYPPWKTLQNSLAEFAIVCIHLISYFLSFFSLLPSFVSILPFLFKVKTDHFVPDYLGWVSSTPFGIPFRLPVQF